MAIQDQSGPYQEQVETAGTINGQGQQFLTLEDVKRITKEQFDKLPIEERLSRMYLSIVQLQEDNVKLRSAIQRTAAAIDQHTHNKDGHATVDNTPSSITFRHDF